jgi:Cu/Zn superoxide dismutase
MLAALDPRQRKAKKYGKNKKAAVAIVEGFGVSSGGDSQRILGKVTFNQTCSSKRCSLKVEVLLSMDGSGFPANQNYRLHVTTNGISDHATDTQTRCDSSGPYYADPKNTPATHIGDFGKVPVNMGSTINVILQDNTAQLSGSLSIIGRSIVLTTEETEGIENSGTRIACGVIGVSEKITNVYF